MKIVCAGCKKLLRENSFPPLCAISHSLCDKCAKELLNGEGLGDLKEDYITRIEKRLDKD